MGTVNRYSKTREGLVMAPVEVEDYTKAGIVKAEADSNIASFYADTDLTYQALEEDQPYLSKKVGELQKGLDSVGESVLNNNVDNSTFDQALRIKRAKNDYFGEHGIVTKAQENFNKVQLWEDELNKLAVAQGWGADRLDRVKNDVRSNFTKSGGTFGNDGRYNTFDASFGPAFIDRIQYFTSEFEKVKGNLTSEEIEAFKGGRYYIAPAKDDPMSLVVVNGTNGEEVTNSSAINSVMQRLNREIKDPTTLVGGEAKFMEWDESAMVKEIADIGNSFMMSTIKSPNYNASLAGNRSLAYALEQEAKKPIVNTVIEKGEQTTMITKPEYGDEEKLIKNSPEVNKIINDSKYDATLETNIENAVARKLDEKKNANLEKYGTVGGVRVTTFEKNDIEEAEEKALQNQLIEGFYNDTNMLEYAQRQGIELPPISNFYDKNNNPDYDAFVDFLDQDGGFTESLESGSGETWQPTLQSTYTIKDGIKKSDAEEHYKTLRQILIKNKDVKIWKYGDSTLQTGGDLANIVSQITQTTNQETKAEPKEITIDYLGRTDYDTRNGWQQGVEEKYDVAKLGAHVVAIDGVKYIIEKSFEDKYNEENLENKEAYALQLKDIDTIYGDSIVLPHHNKNIRNQGGLSKYEVRSMTKKERSTYTDSETRMMYKHPTLGWLQLPYEYLYNKDIMTNFIGNGQYTDQINKRIVNYSGNSGYSNPI